MALKTTTRRAASLALLALAALAWVAPSSAFDYATTGTRSVAADVKSDASAYNAPILVSCDVPRLLGGSCAFAVFNNATTTQTFNVSKQQDSADIVTTFDVDGNAPVSGVATGNSKTVGQKSTVTATIRSCSLCGTRTVDWILHGQSSNVLNWREERVTMTVVFV